MFVYDQVRGYDNYLTNLNYFKDNKLLKGAGVGYYFEGMDDNKFRLSTFKSKLKESKEFRIAFKKLVKAKYLGFINRLDEDETEEDEATTSESSTKTVKKKKKKV